MTETELELVNYYEWVAIFLALIAAHKWVADRFPEEME
jgi:hypothetical protein